MYTGYAVALAVALMFFWTKDPQDLNMVPLVKLFVDTAQISAKIENNKKDNETQLGKVH
jgi:hypothetical protein